MTFRELRLRSGFRSGLRLAQAAGVKQTTVSQLERGANGDAMYSTIEALAKAMGQPVEVVITAVRASKRSADRKRRKQQQCAVEACA